MRIPKNKKERRELAEAFLPIIKFMAEDNNIIPFNDFVEEEGIDKEGRTKKNSQMNDIYTILVPLIQKYGYNFLEERLEAFAAVYIYVVMQECLERGLPKNSEEEEE